jgi:hypothetical protein
MARARSTKAAGWLLAAGAAGSSSVLMRNRGMALS